MSMSMSLSLSLSMSMSMSMSLSLSMGYTKINNSAIKHYKKNGHSDFRFEMIENCIPKFLIEREQSYLGLLNKSIIF
jgi:hypothetical protein